MRSMSSALMARLLVCLLLLLGLLAGCEGDVLPDCPAGTKKEGTTCVLLPVACVPVCGADKPCGEDGCGGSCGTCDSGLVCLSGSCVATGPCVPNCGDSVCGDNGCGGSCGTCEGGQECKAGACQEICVPNCLGKGCGDDSCGGSCGTCASGESCSAAQVCVPTGWTCDPYRYGVDGNCDCGCGGDDPTCKNPGAPLVGCEPYNTCDAGKCVSTLPPGWTCAPSTYGDGILCDCGCGAADSDCGVPGMSVYGCDQAKGEVCDNTGKCGPCVANCDGKICGDDGCGGYCGECPGPTADDPFADQLACVAGKCVDGCVPTPVLCLDAECGDDGCGGTCGECQPGEFCESGTCEIEPGKSCVGYCKGKAPGGCSCEAGCELTKTCCPDYVDVCTCTPKCDGKACGSDGCGGQCGLCDAKGAKPYCDASGQCGTVCAPQCDGNNCGDDGCGGTCGTCAGGASCTGDGKCVAPDWTCLDFYYADGSVCDCSCGAPDPDCAKVALTAGCPSGGSCDATTGICKTPFCGANSDCKSPNWCIGHFAVGGGQQKGVCGLPNPQAKANGTPCYSDGTCASGLCIAGACRAPCQQTSHCGAGESCIGVELPTGLSGKPAGSVGICYGTTTLGAVCTSQNQCKATAEVCLAYSQPTTLQAMLHCGVLPGDLTEQQSCDVTSDCVPGLLCAGGQCRRPCPAGTSDCPANHTCSDAILHHGALAATSDDVTLKACTPVAN